MCFFCLAGRRLAQGRQKLLRHFRRGSGHNLSFRHNRSFKLMRPDGGGGSESDFHFSLQSLTLGCMWAYRKPEIGGGGGD